jgi:hypothetical protein
MDFIDHRSTANFIFSLSATDEKLRIKSDGNVGIGVSNPSTKLEVDGVITTAGLTTTADINFGDNDKAVFGAGSDLQIYHDGSNSYIAEGGTGNLQIQGQNLSLEDSTGTRFFLGIQGGETRLYNQGNEKVAVTSTGIDVTGTVVSDGLTVDGTDVFFNSGWIKSTGSLRIDVDNDNNQTDRAFIVSSDAGTKNIFLAEEGGDISFYEDTGTTAKLTWSASNEKLTVDNNVASSAFVITKGNTTGNALEISNSGSSRALDINHNADGTGTVDDAVRIKDNGTTKFVIDENYNVGIGTSSPSQTLHLKSVDPVIRLEDSNPDGVYAQIDGAGGSLILSADQGNGSANSNIVFKSDNAERMRIDASGFVSIGTTTPREVFHVHRPSSDSSGIRITNTGTGTASTDGLFVGLSSAEDGYVYHYENNPLIFGTNNTERLRIDASGNVGVGVTPENSSGTWRNFEQGGMNLVGRSAGGVDGMVGTNYVFKTNNSEVYKYTAGTSRLFFDANEIKFQQAASGTAGTAISWSEAMRIDASGNLLVGKTTTSNATAGAELNASGQIVGTFASGTHILGRNTNDGSILEFQKDGTAVGSIGTELSRLFIGSDDSMIFFDAGSTNAIWPWTSTATSSGDADNTIDIGDSSNRFKDLYMSGTAYTNALGVGTTSPDVKVDIVDTASDVQLRVYKFDGTNNTRLSFTADDSGAKIHYRDATNGGALRFNNNAGEMARFDASGNLLVGKTGTGIGTVGVEAKADGQLWATRDGNPVLSLNRETSDGSIAVFYKDGSTVGSVGTKLSDGGTSDGELFITSGNTGLFFDDIGSYIRPCNGSAALRDNLVDLGKSDSRFKDLYLSGTPYIGGTSAGQSVIQMLANPTNGANTIHFGDSASGSDTYAGYINYAHDSNSMQFATNQLERLRIDSSGNLLVGQTSESESFVNVKVVDGGQAGITTTTLTGSSASTAIRFRNGNGVVGSIVTSGSATAYNTSSDQRLKENIVDAPSASDDIDAIQVRSFDWKADGSHQKYGMVAQELQSVAPEAVSVPEDSDDMMGVDYSKLVPMLVKEIQSLRARVAQLETN